jgi:hypothetical protein
MNAQFARVAERLGGLVGYLAFRAIPAAGDSLRQVLGQWEAAPPTVPLRVGSDRRTLRPSAQARAAYVEPAHNRDKTKRSY